MKILSEPKLLATIKYYNNMNFKKNGDPNAKITTVSGQEEKGGQRESCGSPNHNFWK